MKNIIKISIKLIFIVLITSSCSRWIAPPYTSVPKMISLETGMTVEKVNEVLGVEPYDLYFLQENKSFILVYNYRTKDRKMTLTNGMDEIHSEEAQTKGTTWYNNSYQAFALFKDGKLKSLITDNGKLNGEILMIRNTNIQLLTKEEYQSIQTFSDDTFYIPLDQNKNENISPEKKKGLWWKVPAGIIGSAATIFWLIILI